MRKAQEFKFNSTALGSVDINTSYGQDNFNQQKGTQPNQRISHQRNTEETIVRGPFAMMQDHTTIASAGGSLRAISEVRDYN